MVVDDAYRPTDRFELVNCGGPLHFYWLVGGTAKEHLVEVQYFLAEERSASTRECCDSTMMTIVHQKAMRWPAIISQAAGAVEVEMGEIYDDASCFSTARAK